MVRSNKKINMRIGDNMKEIKVKKSRNEDDNYVELWKVIDPMKGVPQYYGRYTYKDEGTWYYMSDPLGYCELDRAVENDVMFICCDDSGKECVRYSNRDANPLPKFESVMKIRWEKICKNIDFNKENITANFWSESLNGESTMSVNQWLLSFMDPDLYGKEIAVMCGYDEIWTGSWHSKEIGYEDIPETEFIYLGHRYQFTKVTRKHKICGVEWNEFVCTDSPHVVSKEYGIQTYGYLGNWYDKTTTGTMFDKRTARMMVQAELQKLYPKENKYSKLLFVSGNYCYQKSYEDVAKELIKNELHKNMVHDLISHLKERTQNSIFVSSNENRNKVKKLYPGIYGYDYFYGSLRQ